MLKVNDPLKNRKTLADHVVNEIRERIVSERLPMGAKINQLALTEELGTSRAVVREAFRQLEASGLIRIMPYQHAVVTSLSEEDLDDLWEIRVTVECTAVKRLTAAQDPTTLAQLEMVVAAMEAEHNGETWLQLDREFHSSLCDAGCNPLLLKVMESVRMPIDRFLQSLTHPEPRITISNGEHREILTAIQERNATRAQQVVRQHILVSKRALQARLRLLKKQRALESNES